MKKLYFLFLMVLGSHLANAQTVRYVKPTGSGDGSSWANAASDLQAVINISTAGDQIWVAAGTYYPSQKIASDDLAVITTDRDKAFTLRSGVSIYGGFSGGETLLTARNVAANVTTLSGDLGVLSDKTDNAYHVVIGTGNLADTRLDGFTITAGYASGSDIPKIGTAEFNQGRAGAIFLSQATGSPVFENLLVKNNENAGATQNAGAMYLLSSAAVFNNVTFDANLSIGNGGAVYIFGSLSSPTFSNCTFSSNQASGSGGAIYSSSAGTVNVNNCSFTGNRTASTNFAGAIYILGTATVFNISGSTITNNVSNSGGAIYAASGALNVQPNCVFEGNTSYGNGGAIFSYTATTTIVGSTFKSNWGNSGGAVYIVGTASTSSKNSISNSIFYNNTADTITATLGGGAVYTGSYSVNTLANCTFYQNKSYNLTTGAMSFNNGITTTLNLYNCLFNGNQGTVNTTPASADLRASNGAIQTFKNNLFQVFNTTAGSDDTIADNFLSNSPAVLFANTTPTSPNFLTLASGSVALDAGSNELSTATVDFANNPRIRNTKIDIGAYELQVGNYPLPIELAYYKATKKGSTAVLTWETTSEENNQKFVIERGSSPATLKVFKEMAGAGHSSSAISYSITDYAPLSGANYYRLTQYDNDGKSKVLGIEAVTFELLSAKAQVYPNPAKSYIEVKPASSNGIMSLNLISLTGKTVLTNNYAQATLQNVRLDLTQIPTGTYILWINKGKSNAEKQTLLVVN